MRMSLATKAVAASVIFGCVGMAGAQTNGPTGLSARIGVFFPTSNLARDLAAQWFAFGADYKLQNYSTGTVGQGMPSYISVSADYYQKGDTSAIPIAVNYNVRSGQLVFAAGVGVDFMRVLGNGTTGIGGQVAATYEFAQSGKTNSTPFFIQAKYFLSSKSDLNGFGVFLGVRF